MPELPRQSDGVRVDAETFDCGWWPPGHGEPGESWDFEHAELQLIWDGGDSIDVLVITPRGPRALASVPIIGIARVLAEGPR